MSVAAVRARTRQQQQLQPSTPSPRPSTVRRFTVWNGSSINHPTLEMLAQLVFGLVPPGVWDEVELLLKAGEGGSWQSSFDPSPLAISGPNQLNSLILHGRDLGLRITPYVVVRGRDAWRGPEQAQIRACAFVARRCVLNLEPGSQYWNGPTDPDGIRPYLRGITVPAESLEVCAIPRQSQVDELGGAAAMQAWTDPALVGSASWETYDGVAPGAGPTSLRPDVAIPRLDEWGVAAGAQYRLCVVQRNRIAEWAQTPWAAYGLQVWHLDGNI